MNIQKSYELEYEEVNEVVWEGIKRFCEKKGIKMDAKNLETLFALRDEILYQFWNYDYIGSLEPKEKRDEAC